jgi:hypothetical protein
MTHRPTTHTPHPSKEIQAMSDTLRTADLPTLASTLNDQRTRTLDVVASAGTIRAEGGAIVLRGTEPVITDEGVDTADGRYVPTGVGDEGVAAKLDIPIGYLRRCRDQRPGLYDDNVNGWLAQNPARKFLIRTLRAADGEPRADGTDGVMRAWLSDRYRCIDNFDVLLSVLRGITDAGVTDPIIDADLTDRRMIVRVSTPDVSVLAPKLLEGYRSPFGGHDVGGGWTPERVARASAAERNAIEGGGETVFGGFVITNSETGGGAFTITPRLVVKVCNNGLTITADALKRVHLGGVLDEGIVEWSEATVAKNLALVASQAQDAVRKFLDPDYIEAKVAELEAEAGEPVEDPVAVITTVSKRLGFTADEQANILGHFIKGGQLTAGGVMQAVTSAAQLHTDGDLAADMEAKGVDAMHAAVAAVRSLTKV